MTTVLSPEQRRTAPADDEQGPPHEVPPPSAAEVERFAERLFEAGLAGIELVNTTLGLRLGLYDALASEPATPPQLAARAGIGRRYAREWLEQQAVASVLDVEDADVPADERRYVLPPARGHVLLERDSEAYLAALAEAVVAAATWLPTVEAAFRAGTGIPYADYGVHDLQAAFSRPVTVNHLVQRWLPALPDVHAKLAAGTGRVAEIGCGEGVAAVTIARAFPGVTVDGFDLDDASVAAARRKAQAAGLADRVRFEVADGAALASRGSYDVVLCIEVLHDTSDPVGVLAGMRGLRADDGAVLVVDERVAERFGVPAEPVERLLYAFSTLHCLPAGMAQEPSAATGAVLRPGTLREYAAAAGFATVTELPVEHPQFRLYRLDG